MISLARLISQYPVIQSLSSYLSTLDLYHLALTCKEFHSYILPSKTTFDVLRRNCLCDGHGLAERQACRGLYNPSSVNYSWNNKRHLVWYDEPIEVRLYNVKCGETTALPCRKCGLNVCEECRYYPRERPRSANRRPHLNVLARSENVMCLCRECDPILEDELRGQFLNELCDCDIYTRWICSKCVKEEQTFAFEYYKNHTVFGGLRATKYLSDYGGTRDVSYIPQARDFGNRIC